MNPHLCRVELRPRNALESLDLAMRFSRLHWRPIVLLAVILLLPVWVVAVALASWLGLGGWVAVGVFFLAPITQGAFTLLVAQLLFAEHVSVRHVLRAWPSSWGGTFLALFGTAAEWLLATVSVGMLWPFARVAWLYLRETWTLERAPMGASISRALQLAMRTTSQALPGAIVCFVLMLWVPLASEAVGQSLVDFVLQLGQPFGSLLDGDVTPYLLAGLLALQPILAIYRVFLYVDARTRNEGWDLQNALRALQGAS